MDNHADHSWLLLNYWIVSHPAVYFIDPDGNLISKKEELLYPEDLLSLGKRISTEGPKIIEMRAQYYKGNRDPEFLSNYTKMIEDFQLLEAEPVLEYLHGLDDEELHLPENLIMILKYVQNYNSREFQSILQNKDIGEPIIGVTNWNKHIRRVLLNTLTKQLEENDSAGLETLIKSVELTGNNDLKETVNYGYVLHFIDTDYLKALEYAKKMKQDPRILEEDLFNTVAWAVYENTSEEDHELLLVAKDLSRRSLEMADHSYNNDTYASILYKLGETELAIQFMNRAVFLAEKEGSSQLKDFKQKLETWEENN
jgi:tetratricopeptide (TPR) repeat protein